MDTICILFESVSYLIHLDGDRKVEIGGLATSQFPLAGNVAFPDNSPRMSTTMKPRSLVGQLEFWLISTGMSVFAYLLEKMILRSVKGGGAKP